MVVFGRHRKSKSPAIFGSPEKEHIISSRTPPTPQPFTPPVLRNFSYPTSIASGTRTPTYPSSSRAGQTTWDQLGEICNFSPDSPSHSRTGGLEDPFFFHHERNQYHRLADRENNSLSPSPLSRQHLGQISSTPSKEIGLKKRHRRSTLLGLPVSQAQNTQSFSRNIEAGNLKARPAKASKESPLGDHIFPSRTSVTARFRRSSLGHQKAAASFDISQLASLWSKSVDLPASGSRAPSLNCRPYPALNGTDYQNTLEQGILKASSADTTSILEVPTMDTKSQNISAKRRSKDGKSRWLSQIKEWVSVSEPSTQALKQHKKDAYKRAGVALDDPRGPAKLHIPVTALPPEAIRPYGPGPDPEEIARRKAEQRKQARQSYTSTGGTSRRSRSSASQHSSMSSLGLSSPGLTDLKKVTS